MIHQRQRRMITTSEELYALIERLRGCERIGLDVETLIPTQELCLVQIASDLETAIIDPLAIPDITSLGEILSSPLTLKVIHNASFEQRVLGMLDFTITPIFDTLKASRNHYKGQRLEGGHKLSSVCQREMNVYMDKSQQTSNWSIRPLSQAQLNYAALDAEVLLGLHDVFR